MRILVVEDEPAVLQALRCVLEQETYTVDTAVNGEQALQAVARDPPNLIILDLWMPVMNGWEFLRRLRDLEPPRGAIPVIAVSADVKAGTKLLPVQAFLPKPMDIDRLLAEVREHVATV
jgi:two-component system nitrogen regulation response regulator NtrX